MTLDASVLRHSVSRTVPSRNLTLLTAASKVGAAVHSPQGHPNFGLEGAGQGAGLVPDRFDGMTLIGEALVDGGEFHVRQCRRGRRTRA